MGQNIIFEIDWITLTVWQINYYLIIFVFCFSTKMYTYIYYFYPSNRAAQQRTAAKFLLLRFFLFCIKLNYQKTSNSFNKNKLFFLKIFSN